MFDDIEKAYNWIGKNTTKGKWFHHVYFPKNEDGSTNVYSYKNPNKLLAFMKVIEYPNW